ncbi:hypothetical protein D515_04792 [Grimontia indica]|uniref:Uncharacterized protein n=1 Tax=Grimontia indica TaxID=1056512 RepID=R1GLJ7_9GAMM|nr:hypothetical protein D515_04792 [Grimontia indica]
MKLPGSRSTVWNNDLDSNASSSRSYPLYDEPMGLFTLLTTPTVHTYKKYEKISDKIGFKVTTSFKPSNVIFASNSKSGLYFNGWSGQSEGDVAVTGRIKVKYLAGPDATVNFSNFNDIDGDNSEYNYVNVKTNGRDMKLYTVVSDDVSLMHLGHFLGSDKGAPKITASGDTVLVDNVSLVVTAKNHGSTIKDHNLNSSINLIDEKDESGRRFPYYLVMKEYPVEFNSHSNQKSFNPSEDINRLINTGQLGGVTHDNDLLGLQLNLGRNNGIKVQGYCDVQGEYNNTHEIRSDGEYSIIADEDMNYYTYEPKQVSSPGEAILDVTRDPCIICARSETWPFYSFNLNEYISRYGFREPKEVTLRINRQSIAVYQMYLYDYAKNYLFSANKSTKPMTDNSHGEGIPKYSTFISNTDWNGQDFNVTEQFKNALNRVKNSNGKYELPRVSVVLDYVPGYGTYTVFSSENDRLDAPQIIINFDDEL